MTPPPGQHRRFEFGDLAGSNVLDTRQYRDDQPCADRVAPPCPEQRDPRRSILGGSQVRWLFRNLAGSGCGWELLAQQVFFAQRDLARTRVVPYVTRPDAPLATDAEFLVAADQPGLHRV